MADKTLWHRWFAWKPIAFGPFMAWMCFVQRRKDHNGEWLYRRDRFVI